MESYQELIDTCESEIRAGHTQRASQRLSKLNPAQAPRGLRLKLANLCRRVGLVPMGLKLLWPIASHEKRSMRDGANAHEMAEYAVLLLRNGSVQEALATLRDIDAEVAPEALLIHSFCLFNTWEYGDAVPLLERYIERQPDMYMKFVGRVNLAAALVGTKQNDRARALLDESIQLAREKQFLRLTGNCFELRAQIHVATGEYRRAESDLESAARFLGGNSARDYFYVRKWQAVVTAHETKSVELLRTIRAEAAVNRDWESVREADLLMLRTSFDQGVYEHLVFGTPFPNFRTKVAEAVGCEMLARSYVLGRQDAAVFDVMTGGLSDGEELAANPGKKIHQLIEILSRDFYRPLKLGGLFAELFPGEYFDVFSSPDRVHQALRRTRRWIETSGLPLAIVEDAGDYSLRITGALGLRVPLVRESVDGMKGYFQRIRQSLPIDADFSVDDVLGTVDVSRATAKRFVAWAMENGTVERRARGRYRLVADSLKSRKAA